MTERLRIAQVAPVGGPVTPDTWSSIEYLVSLLTEELVRRGHEVTLFATGDSQTSAALHAVYPSGSDLWEWEFHQLMQMAAVFERAGDFDVIHSHAYHFALPFTRLAPAAVVHTHHTIPERDIIRGYARYPEARVVAVSHYQRHKVGIIPDVRVIHNGIDTDTFPFSRERGDYLLFLGKMAPQKGPAEAVRVARRAGLRLILAGPAGHGAEAEYFHAAVEPLIDGRTVEYVGPVGVEERNRLLAGAAALVYPINVAEAFGLVMIEAMACGTPVAAVERGTVREIVDDGVTGCYAQDPDALAARIPEVVALDRARVRQVAVARFDYRRMVDEYLAMYRPLAGSRRGGAAI